MAVEKNRKLRRGIFQKVYSLKYPYINLIVVDIKYRIVQSAILDQKIFEVCPRTF
jgi:hypothetical protein